MDEPEVRNARERAPVADAELGGAANRAPARVVGGHGQRVPAEAKPLVEAEQRLLLALE